MRKITEILRLHYHCRRSQREIAQSVGLSKSAVAKCLARAQVAGITWPLDSALDDKALERRLYPPLATVVEDEALPDWSVVSRELRRKGVTKLLLWEEYRALNPHGLGYSRFCERFLEWQKNARLSMRQVHKAGEKLFVDFTGTRISIHNVLDGSRREAEIFVATWGASNCTFATATFSQDLPSWIKCHIDAFNFFGCIPEVLVPDNLKSGVTKACHYDPDINQTYLEFANHYDVAVIPAHAGKPKHKAKVEFSVLLVTRWIIAALRKRKFFSLDELNEAIAELLVRLNAKPFQKMPGSRQSVFENLDRPAAKPLPSRHYVYAETTKAKVNIDYHVVIDDHFYSVPYQLRGEHVTCRTTSTAIEILYKNRRIYTHARSYKKWDYTTVKEHMPESHRRYLEWTPSRILSWATTIGPNTTDLMQAIMGDKQHAEQGYRGCLGIFRLAKHYGRDRIEAACARALAAKAHRYKHVKAILENGLDRKPLETAQALPVIHHDNIRGGSYYQQLTEENTHHGE